MSRLLLFMILSVISTNGFAWQWVDLWKTGDQQGIELLNIGKAHQASQVFKDTQWKGSAAYRAGEYSQALAEFSTQKTSDGQYNAGNAAAQLGQYQEAVTAYDKAIALNPNNVDAISNRDIVKKLLEKQNKENKQNKQKNSSQSKDSADNSKENKSQQNQSDSSSSQNNPQPNKADQRSSNANNNQESQASRDQSKENDKQLLRRLADDPGGLLRQKFLRDYLRRHARDD